MTDLGMEGKTDAGLYDETHEQASGDDCNIDPTGGSRRVKLLSPIANAQTDEACGSLAIGPFRRLTASLPGPKLWLSPQPHRDRHELRPPALATPARHPGSGRPPGRRLWHR